MNIPKLALRFQGGRDRNGIMEGHAQSLMCLVAALVIEHVVLQVFHDGEERAALRIGDAVDAVGAERTLDDSGCEQK